MVRAAPWRREGRARRALALRPGGCLPLPRGGCRSSGLRRSPVPGARLLSRRALERSGDRPPRSCTRSERDGECARRQPPGGSPGVQRPEGTAGVLAGRAARATCSLGRAARATCSLGRAARATYSLGRAARATCSLGRAARATYSLGRAARATCSLGRAARATCSLGRAARATCSLGRAAAPELLAGRAAVRADDAVPLGRTPRRAGRARRVRSLEDLIVTTFNAGVGSSTLPLFIYSKIRFGWSPPRSTASPPSSSRSPGRRLGDCLCLVAAQPAHAPGDQDRDLGRRPPFPGRDPSGRLGFGGAQADPAQRDGLDREHDRDGRGEGPRHPRRVEQHPDRRRPRARPGAGTGRPR